MKKIMKIVMLIQERLHRLDAAPELCSFFLQEPQLPVIEIRETLSGVDGKVGLGRVISLLEQLPWSETIIEEALRGLQKELGWNTKTYFMSLRLAILGSKVSPPLFGSIEIIGREASAARVKRAIESL